MCGCSHCGTQLVASSLFPAPRARFLPQRQFEIDEYVNLDISYVSRMANLKIATFCPAFDFELSLMDDGLQSLLKRHKLDQPRLLAALVPKQLAGEDLSQRVMVLLDGLGAAGHTEEWRPQLLSLLLKARAEAPQLADRAGRLTGAQISADTAQREREQQGQQEEAEQRRLQAARLAHLPTVWQGKRYRREAVLVNEDERAQAEDAARAHWAKEVAGLLVEADLPFARTLGAKEGSLLTQRCCRGLRAKTLEQRVVCWRPLRRWLLATGGPCFPTTPEHFLGYLEARGATTRTTGTSLLSALRFLEEAGEVPAAQRLSSHPAFSNASREARAAPGKGKPKKVSPPMVLAILAAFEAKVVDEDAALYTRAFAWYRLFRHWSSLRWDDTQALSPHSLRRR